jgi:hypothetical protein
MPENSSSFLPQERTNGGSGGRDDVDGRKARHLDGVVWRIGRMERRRMEKKGWIKYGEVRESGRWRGPRGIYTSSSAAQQIRLAARQVA